MSAPLEAFVGHDGEGWFVTPVIFAASSEASATQLRDDEQPEEMIWLEGAEGLQDLGCENLHALLLLLGVAHQYECRGCPVTIWSEWPYRTGKSASPMDGDLEELPDPVRVEGVGLFCSRECWERHTARQAVVG